MKYHIFVFLLVTSVIGRSQTAQIAEADVQLESIFIEAVRNKLIDRHDLTIPQFREIIKKQPQNHVAWYELGFALFKTKQWDESLDAVQKALTYQPKQPQYLFLLADIYHSKQDVLNEANTYKKIQIIRPHDESLYSRWADVLISANHHEEAIKVLSQLESQKGINEISSLKKALLFDQIGKPKEAEAELLKLNDAFPSEVRYLHALANHYVKAQKQNKANEVFKSILMIQPADERANLALAASYRQNGQDEKYLISIQSLMSNPTIPLDVKIIELIPYLQKAIANNDKDLLLNIEKYTQELTISYPKDAKTFAISGDVLVALNKRAEAYAHYKKSITLNNAIKAVWYQYLDLASVFEEPEVLAKTGEDAFDLFPNDVNIALGYTDALIRNQNYSSAASILHQAQLMVGNQKVLLERIYSLEYTLALLNNKMPLAQEFFAKTKALNPKSMMIYGIPIQHCVQANQLLDIALDLILKAEKEFPQVLGFSGYKGIILFRNKKYEEGKKALDIAMSQPTVPVFVMESYGDTLYMLKEVDQAIAIWKKAAESNPYHQKLKKKILDKTIE